MKTAFYAGVAASALLCHAPTAALALTPEDVWERWQAQAAEGDITITAGDESSRGGTLTLSNVAFAAELDEDGTLTGTIAEVVLSDAGGGTVEVQMSETIPVTVTGTDIDGATATAALTLSAPDLLYTVAEGPEGGTDATYSAEQISVSIDSVSEDGEPFEMDGTFTGENIAGDYTVSGGETQQIISNVTTDVLRVNLAGTDPEEGGTFSLSMVMNDIVSASSSTGGMMMMLMSDPEALAAGGSTQGEGSASDITMAISVEDGSDTFDLSLTMDGGTGSADFGADRVEYAVLYEGIAFAASGSEIPFPQATGSLGAWETDVSLPTGSTDESVPADVKFALRDVVMGEEIWMMFDPMGSLARDPATIVLDLGAQVRVLQSLFSDDMMMSAEMPVEPDALDVRELLVSAVGARLAGSGAFSFDWSQPGQFGPGSPLTDGTLNLSLMGSQTLLNTLSGMGLIGPQEVAGVNMMLGMIGQRGEGEDEIVSEITISPSGGVLANGMPLPIPF